MTSIKRYIFRGAATGLAASAGNIAVVFTLTPLLIALMGAENYGVWALCYFFVGLGQLGDIGLSRAVTQLLMGPDNKDRQHRLQSAGLVISMIMIAVVGMLLWLGYLLGWRAFKSNSSISDSLYNSLLVAGTVTMFSAAAISILRGVIESQMRITFLNSIQFFQTLSLNVVAILAWLWFGTLDHSIGAFGLTYVLILTVLAAICFRTGFRVSAFGWAELRQVFRTASGYFASAFFNVLLLPFNRFVALEAAPTAVVHAIFDIAVRISEAATGLLTALSSSLFSQFLKLGRLEVLKIRLLVRRSELILFGCYVCGCVLYYFLAPFVSAWLLPEHAAALVAASVLLVPLRAVTGVAEPATRAIWAFDRVMTLVPFRIALLALSVLIVLVTPGFDPLMRVVLAFGLPLAIMTPAVMIWFRIQANRITESLDPAASKSDRFSQV